MKMFWVISWIHYNFFAPLIIHTFGLLLLRITTKLQECTEITTVSFELTSHTT